MVRRLLPFAVLAAALIGCGKKVEVPGVGTVGGDTATANPDATYTIKFREKQTGDRFEVTERIDYAGEVVTPLDEEEARRVAALLRKRGATTVAVCFINSYVNPANEIRMREILEEELPDAAVPRRFTDALRRDDARVR